MSGVGRVGGTTPPPEPPDTTPDTTGTTTPATTRTRTPPTARPPAPDATSVRMRRAEHPSGVPTRILEKYGLDPQKPSTKSEYKGTQWNVGYMPYDGDQQYVAFAKAGAIFKNPNAGNDGHPYWSRYASPPTGLQPGSWIMDGTISEDGFETAAGVDISGDRPISNALLKYVSEAGVPGEAKFSLRDKDGKELTARAGDKLTPTYVKDNKIVEVEKRGGPYYPIGSDTPLPWEDADKVALRLKGSDGTIRGAATDKIEDRSTVLGLQSDVKFDFLDETGDPIAFNPSWQQIVPTYSHLNKWHAFVPQRDAAGKITGYEHQTLDQRGTRVTARERVTPEQMKTLTNGKDVIHRVQDKSTGRLNGDGKVGLSYDMSWWGKCHNVASIGTSNMPLPKQDVNVVTNLNERAGESLALEYTKDGAKHVLMPVRDANGKIASYADRTVDAQGRVTASRDLSLADGKKAATDNKAGPVIVSGHPLLTLKKAQVTRADTEDVTSLTAHRGDGAVQYKGSMGARYWGMPDEVALRNGRNLSGWVTEVETEGGKKITVGSKSAGDDYYESNRDVLRGPGLNSGYARDGSGRQIGWSQVDWDKLQASKQGNEKIKTVTITKPDGTTEKVKASDVESLGWENKYDIRPDSLWKLHKKDTVSKDGSTVVEADPGSHVWNYTITGVETTPLKASQVSEELKKKPGQLKGTTDPADRHYFKTEINGSEHEYWVKFDRDGNITDYAYADDCPDFFWTQHVKDAYTTEWTGESQAPGLSNREIQRLYTASVGGYDPYALPGNVLSQGELLTRRPVKPAATPPATPP